MPTIKPCCQSLFAPTVLALSLALVGAPALAADRYWTYATGCGSADWFGRADGSGTCWAASLDGATRQSVPTAQDNVFIQHDGASDLGNAFSNSPHGAPRTGFANELAIAGKGRGFASLSVARDTLEIGPQLRVGDQGLGRFMQTGGAVSSGTVALGVGAGAEGRYELAAGSLTARWKVAVGGGGHGEFAQTGGNLSTFIFTVGEPFDLAAGAPLRRSSFVISAGMADISFSAIVGAYFQDGASGGLPDAGYGQLQITGSAVLKADFMNVWATGLLKIDGGTLSVRQLSARPNTFAMSDGVLQFTGAASYTDIDTGLGNTPLPLSFGAGLGSGNPTVRLASNSTLSLPQIDVGIFGKGRLEIGPGAQLNTTTASLGQGFGSVPGSGQAAVAGAGARWKNSGALVIGGLSGPGSQLTLTDGGTLVNGGTLTLRPGSSIYVAGGSLSAPKIISQGTIDLDQGGQHTWAGDLELRSGSLLLVKAPFTAQGAVDVAAGARIENSNFMRFEGMVALQQGALVSGDGTKVFAGSLKVSGDDPGVFTDLSTDALVLLAPSNTYFADIGAGSFDRYVVNGQFVLGGTLKLVSFGGYTGHTGDHFDLFDAAHLSGSFARIDTSSFTLAQGLSWDFSQLGSSGVVSITGVPAPIPEPGTWALWLAGLAWLGARACRRGL